MSVPHPTQATEFMWRVHVYSTEHIRFADQKAAAVIAWCGGLIGVLFATKAHQRFMAPGAALSHADVGAVTLALASFFAFAILAAAACFAFWCVKPRLWSREHSPGHVPGYIYWETVRAHANPATFSTAVTGLSAAELDAHLVEHVYVLAGIARLKYLYVDRSIWVGFVGSAVAALVTLFSP